MQEVLVIFNEACTRRLFVTKHYIIISLLSRPTSGCYVISHVLLMLKPHCDIQLYIDTTKLLTQHCCNTRHSDLYAPYCRRSVYTPLWAHYILPPASWGRRARPHSPASSRSSAGSWECSVCSRRSLDTRPPLRPDRRRTCSHRPAPTPAVIAIHHSFIHRKSALCKQN